MGIKISKEKIQKIVTKFNHTNLEAYIVYDTSKNKVWLEIPVNGELTENVTNDTVHIIYEKKQDNLFMHATVDTTQKAIKNVNQANKEIRELYLRNYDDWGLYLF